ncbi:hypothetical protein [Actibacterium sp. 188UL27-1]|uniref:hypothetical protein n=1 Tax=Actibacterium sp. 188UL27-1 TaxID=2786961 RepID=UPI00195D0675|nr:hypothetical protein [Actibacterium sp. 188UL27-1]MBM7066781.1 hypothetical protein [Actibacterium sp. 188UL27-1]
MTLYDTLEGVMLGCFSIGWYWSIFTMVRTGRPSGKSAVFVCFTVAGYGCGLTAHIIALRHGAPFTYLVVLYAWNLAVTLIDLSLVVLLTRRTLSFPTATGLKSVPPAPVRFRSETVRGDG